MPLKTYLLNKLSNRKCRLNNIWPSNRLPHKEHLRRVFSDRLLYGPEDLPPKVDLRNNMTTVENQSNIGSCSANALAGAYEYLEKKHHGESIDVSRLFIYYNGRIKENSSNTVTDSGCTMTSAIEALEEFGTCLESIWPYNVSRVNTRPSNEAYQAAKSHKISEALQVRIDLHEMKSCLAQGFPFVFGLRLFASFDKAATTGVVPMPSSNDRSRQSDGSHALVAVGYSDQSQSFIVRNSWGQDWGDRGYCYIPYAYVTDQNLCFDAWTIRKIHNDNFGQDHWDYDDPIDYQNVDNYDDDDDDYNRAIEHVEEDDFGTNFDASGFSGNARNRDDNFASNGSDEYGQQRNPSYNSNYYDGNDYRQQWNQDYNSGYNGSGNYGQQWNQDYNSGYNGSGNYDQQWNRDAESNAQHRHGHGHHHHHHHKHENYD